MVGAETGQKIRLFCFLKLATDVFCHETPGCGGIGGSHDDDSTVGKDDQAMITAVEFK